MMRAGLAVTRASVAAPVADEAAVDLDRIDREAAQVSQRRIAGAKIVDCQPHARALQAR